MKSGKLLRRALCVVLAVTAVFSLTSCSSSYTLSTYTDEDDVEWELVLDSDGKMIVNSNGRLKVYSLSSDGNKILNDNGEYRTTYVDFNGQIVYGRYVITQKMRFKLPINFEQSYSTGLLFTYSDKQGEITINECTGTFDEVISQAEVSLAAMQESYGSDYLTYDTGKLELKKLGVTATVFSVHSSTSNYPYNQYIYYFEYDDVVYCVSCKENMKYDNIRFDAFVKTIEFVES